VRSGTKSAGAPLLKNIKKHLSCDAGGSAELDGSISVVPSFHFAPQWGLFPPSVTQVTFTGTVAETAALTTSASASAQCTLEKTPLLATPIQFTPIEVTVGVVPVVIVPTLPFYISADGHVELSITAGATQQAAVTAGVDYANGTFTPIGQSTNSFTDSLPSVSALDGPVQGSVGTALSLLLYDVAGPAVDIDGSMQFAVTPAQTPWCQLSAGLDAGAGLVVPILDLDYSNPSIFSHTFQLAQCNGPLPSGSITVAQQVVGPAPSSDWAFGGDLGRFALPAVGGSKVFQRLIAGNYTLTVTPQPGYGLSTSCSDGVTGTNSVTVTLATGQGVTCTFVASATSTSPQCDGDQPVERPHDRRHLGQHHRQQLHRDDRSAVRLHARKFLQGELGHLDHGGLAGRGSWDCPGSSHHTGRHITTESAGRSVHVRQRRTRRWPLADVPPRPPAHRPQFRRRARHGGT